MQIDGRRFWCANLRCDAESHSPWRPCPASQRSRRRICGLVDLLRQDARSGEDRSTGADRAKRTRNVAWDGKGLEPRDLSGRVRRPPPQSEVDVLREAGLLGRPHWQPVEHEDDMIDCMRPKAKFLFTQQDKPCSLIDIDEMHSLISALDERKDDLGCTVFPKGKDSENVVVIFAGAMERFFALSLAVGLDCEVIYFQDYHSHWYLGSSILPPVEAIAAGFLKDRIGNRRPIFMGQSSGGYASLVAGRHFDKSVVIACSPQVFSDKQKKGRINLAGIPQINAVEGIIDIASYWSNVNSNEMYISAIYSASETGNPISSFVWMDHLHISSLLNVESINVYLMPTDTHSFLHGRAKHFSALLQEVGKTKTRDMHALIMSSLTALFA